jgi:hypothetical protein
MKNKYFKIIPLLLICITSIFCNAQKEGCVVTNTNDTLKIASINHMPSFYNYSFLGNPDTMYEVVTHLKPKGKMKIKVSDIRYLKIIDLKNKDTSIYIPIKDSARLYTYGHDISKVDKMKKRKRYIKATTFTFYRFQKVLVAKGNLSIYVKNYAVEVYTGNDVIGANDFDDYMDVAIFSNNKQVVTIYDNDSQNDKLNIAKAVLQFVNTRYKLNLTHDELVNKYFAQGVAFDKQKKLFNFIIDKEAELEKQEK